MVPASERRARQAPCVRRRVLGIDPGTVVTGWGVVEVVGSSLAHIAHGTIVTSDGQRQAARLNQIYQGIQEVLETFNPTSLSLEKVFFARNVQSALKLGQARGIALLAAAQNNLSVDEYSAAEIKVAVVGYGQATKEQVQMMVASLLHLPSSPSADAADGLAAAICHLHRAVFQTRVAEALPNLNSSQRRRGLS